MQMICPHWCRYSVLEFKTKAAKEKEWEHAC